ncbi:MAG: hypothetical protein AB7P35_17900 [Hyphomonadaceae bacterium]
MTRIAALHRLRDFVRDHTYRTGEPPSIREIAVFMGYASASVGAAHGMVRRAIALGLLRQISGRGQRNLAAVYPKPDFLQVARDALHQARIDVTAENATRLADTLTALAAQNKGPRA